MPILLSLGLHVRSLSGDEARLLPGAPDQAVIIERVLPGSPAYQTGLQAGMRLLAVGKRSVSNRAEAEAAANAINPDAGIPLEILTPRGRTARPPTRVRHGH